MNNKITKLFVLLMLLGVGVSKAQFEPTPYNALITLDDSTLVTDSTRILSGFVPQMLLVQDDSMDVAFTGTFQVSYGLSTARRWYDVRDDDSTYSVLVPADTSAIKLNPDVFKSLVGAGENDYDNYVWVRLIASKAQDGDQKFYIRQGKK